MNDQPNAPAPEFAWEDPPPAAQRSFKDIPDALRKRRGEWARIADERWAAEQARVGGAA